MDDLLRNAWCDLNKRFSRSLIYRVGIEAGFFSEYNNMILAMLYSLEHKLHFVLDSSSCNFHENGWNGFFEPFCENVIDTNEHFRPYDWRLSAKLIFREHTLKYVRNMYPYLSFWKKKLLTQDVFAKSRDRTLLRKYFYQPTLGINGDIQQAWSQLVKLTWVYNKDTKRKIDAHIANLALPDMYIGMHIRVGDKYVEHRIEAIDKYFSCVRKSVLTRNLFALTDDYSVIEEISTRYPDWTVYTLCSKTERGYFHDSFMKESIDFRQNQLIKLFASIDILSNAQQFIGTYSSNPGMYIGMRNPNICTGVDFDHWMIW